MRRCEVYWQTGISPDAADTTGITPLMLDGHPQDHGAVAELLLARGADVNASDNGGVTALMLTASNGRTALLQRLVNRGTTINARSDAGWTPLTYVGLEWACACGSPLARSRRGSHTFDGIGWNPRFRSRDGEPRTP